MTLTPGIGGGKQSPKNPPTSRKVFRTKMVHTSGTCFSKHLKRCRNISSKYVPIYRKYTDSDNRIQNNNLYYTAHQKCQNTFEKSKSSKTKTFYFIIYQFSITSILYILYILYILLMITIIVAWGRSPVSLFRHLLLIYEEDRHATSTARYAVDATWRGYVAGGSHQHLSVYH